jgi:hypothetical protein
VLGSGVINIGNDSIDYLAKAALVKPLEGGGSLAKVSTLVVPVRVRPIQRLAVYP